MAEIQESSLPRLPEGLGNTDICKLEGYFNLQVSICIYVSPIGHFTVVGLVSKPLSEREAGVDLVLI